MARSNSSNSAYALDAAAGTTSLKQYYIANSPWFSVVASICYASTAVSLVLSNWNIYLVILLFVILLWDYQRVIFLYGLRTNKFSVRWLMPDCDHWQYGLSNGRCYKAELIRQRSFSSSLLLIFYLRHRHGARYLIIPRDSLSKHQFRALAYLLNSRS